MWLYHRLMSPNDADRMANSVDPDQTAPLGAVWSGSALFAQAYLSENLGSLRYIKNICCGYLLELHHRGNSNEYPQHLFLWKIVENYSLYIESGGSCSLCHQSPLRISFFLSLALEPLAGTLFLLSYFSFSTLQQRIYEPWHDKTNTMSVCTQQRPRSALASAQSDQSLVCALNR